MLSANTMAQATIHNALGDTHASQHDHICSIELETDNAGKPETAVVNKSNDNKAHVKCTCQSPAGFTCLASVIPTDKHGSVMKLQKIVGNSDNVDPSMTSESASDYLKLIVETPEAEVDQTYGTLSLLYFSFTHSHIVLSTYIIMGFIAASLMIRAFHVQCEWFAIVGPMLMVRALLYSKVPMNEEENKNGNTTENTLRHELLLELVRCSICAPYNDTCPCYGCNFGLSVFYTIPGVAFLVIGFPFRLNPHGEALFVSGIIITGIGFLFGYRQLVFEGRFQKVSNSVRTHKCCFALILLYVIELVHFGLEGLQFLQLWIYFY